MSNRYACYFDVRRIQLLTNESGYCSHCVHIYAAITQAKSGEICRVKEIPINFLPRPFPLFPHTVPPKKISRDNEFAQEKKKDLSSLDLEYKAGARFLI